MKSVMTGSNGRKDGDYRQRAGRAESSTDASDAPSTAFYKALLEGLSRAQPALTLPEEEEPRFETMPAPRSDDCGAEGLDTFPSAHDPRDRKLVLHMKGWQLRAYPKGDPRHEFFAPRGLLHLQLWHPAARVSVLTPCQLTRGRLELFPVQGRRLRLSSYWQLRDLLKQHHQIEPPSPPVLAAAIRWFVVRAERGSEAPGDDALAHYRSRSNYPAIEGLSGDSVLPLEGLELPDELRVDVPAPSEDVSDEPN